MIFKDESLKNNISILLLIMVSSGIFGIVLYITTLIMKELQIRIVLTIIKYI